MKGLPTEPTYEERYRTSILRGPGSFSAGKWSAWFPSCCFQTWRPTDEIRLGSFTSIAAGVHLLVGGEHDLTAISTYTFSIMSGADWQVAESIPSARITIGSDAWVATNSIVLGNVTIGHGAVIAAGSVVTRDIPAYAMAAGAPARVLRFRFEPDQVNTLLEMAWWDWPDDLILAAEPLLRASDIQALRKFYLSRVLQSAT